MIDPKGLLVLLLDATILAVFVLRPFVRNYDESDRGAGNFVAMRPPLKPSYARCTLFIVTSFVVSALIVAIRTPSLDKVYHSTVQYLLGSVVADPLGVSAYVTSLLPVFQVSVLAFGVAFAVSFRSSLARRLVILLNVGLFLVISAVVDALFGVFVLVTGIPLGPTPVVNMLIQYMIAGIVMFRVTFTSFQLPNVTPLPLRRRGDWIDDIVVVVCLGSAVAITMAGAVYLTAQFGSTPLVFAAIAFACPPYLLIFITVFLGLFRLARYRRVDPGPDRPPLEVIIPAFNEELNIALLLASLDEAAGRYRGPVTVILCDDGSVDDTRLLASHAIDAFRWAEGRIIEGRHNGKSAALNRALAECRSDFVYRVDADCIVHPDCFVYSVPHFLADPRIGMVGAFTLPKEPYTTWIDRMRLFEMIVGFGMGRPAADVVDGVACVPGTFTAFRRQAALEIGGFVEGMYGEDLDFTCGIARMGWRVVVDTRVRSFEDVPNTQAQLRIQRTRWNRGGSMAFARYTPVATGLAGPRFWFFTTRAGAKRFLVPLHISTLAYVVALSIFNPTTHLNLARVGFILGFKAVPAVLQVIGCAVYYRKGRYLGWLPVRYAFVMLKHYYGLEAFLSFNARPVITDRVAEALRPAGRAVEPPVLDLTDSGSLV
jgi:cellulose synthase/poly-beta-1,6-N-acetylglucosamine synthase-like glycosyltransferase